MRKLKAKESFSDRHGCGCNGCRAINNAPYILVPEKDIDFRSKTFTFKRAKFLLDHFVDITEVNKQETPEAYKGIFKWS